MALFDHVQLGDIVLFSDIYWITSLLTRFGTVSRWTHVAMVVGLPQSSRDDVLIFEISNTLVHPLYDHLSETYKKKGARVVSLRERLKQYPKHGESVMIMSLVNQHIPRPMISFYLESELIEILNCMKNVSFRDSWHLLLRAAISHNWRAFRPSAIRRDLKIIYELQYRKLTLFCSEALIIVLQELGILSRFCNPKRYVPADFGCRYYKDNVQPPLLPLKRGWNYTPLLCLRLKALR
jgi:hypothetical protein